jgi:AsmA-like C-terminal region
MSQTGGSFRIWFILPAVLLAVILFAGGVFFWRTRHMDNFVRLWVIRSLSQQFEGRVELRAVHVTGFPQLGVTGEDLAIHFDGHTDLPPLIHVDKFTFRLGMLALLRFPRHVSSVRIENMTISIPPREDNRNPKISGAGKANKLLSSVILDEVTCKDTTIITLPRKAEPGKPQKTPLEWAIHDLNLTAAGEGKPFHFQGTLTNAKPKGEIDTSGDFGPWDLDDPGVTPVSGAYKFTDADLGPFPGIAGILSSTGRFTGELAELQVDGETDTPDFSLDKIGKPVPLHTEFSATVDGTNGNTLLHPVRATLVRSLIIAEGSVIKEPENRGHTIVVNFGAPNARIQDILRLAVDSDKPFLTGTVKIEGKLVVPPSHTKALEKLILDGEFGLDDARWSSQEVREKLQALSRRAEGKPADEDAGSAVSDLRGNFHVEKGIVKFSSLTFSVPGAAIDLTGTYQLAGGALDFNGHLRLQAKLSQTVTGARSFFLKAVDPFFKKDGAGALVPISITGTREQATIGVTIFHKTVEKKLGDAKSSFK